MKFRKSVVFGLVVALMLVFANFSPVMANSENTAEGVCPSGGDWVKVDGLTGSSYTYTAPAGKEIVAWCYKASTTVNSGVVSPPASSYTVTSTVPDGGIGVKDLSHASFQLQDIVIPVENTASLTIINNCSGGHIVVNASAGASYGSLPSWTWNNIYVTESVLGGSIEVTFSSGTPLSITLTYPEIFEWNDCLITLDHEIYVTVLNDCTLGYGWDVTASPGGVVVYSGPKTGLWTDPYKQETSPSNSVMVTWPDAYVKTLNLDAILEPTNCTIVLGHEYEIETDPTCEGYSWVVKVVDGTYETNDPLSGVWTEKYKQEKSGNPAVKIVWNDGVTLDLNLDTLYEPLNCVPDLPTPEPTPTPVPQKTGAGDSSIPWTLPLLFLGFGVGLFFVLRMFKKQ